MCTVPHQFSSVAQSCPTLCDPMNRSTPGLPVHHQLPESTQTHVHWISDATQLSHPLSSPPPALNLSQHQGLFKWISSLHQVAKVLEFDFPQNGRRTGSQRQKGSACILPWVSLKTLVQIYWPYTVSFLHLRFSDSANLRSKNIWGKNSKKCQKAKLEFTAGNYLYNIYIVFMTIYLAFALY